MHRDFAAGKIKKDEKHLAVFWFPAGSLCASAIRHKDFQAYWTN